MVLNQVQVGLDAREEEFRTGYIFQTQVQLGTRIDVMEEEARIVQVPVVVKSDAMERGPSDSDGRKQPKGHVIERKTPAYAVNMFIGNGDENLKHIETLGGKRRSLLEYSDKFGKILKIPLKNS